MQKSWRNDHDKLTFIVCLPLSNEDLERAHETSMRLRRCDMMSILQGGEHDSPEKMVGDVNLFLSRDEDDEAGIIGEYVHLLILHY